jgi:CheY-like chemotaxis protein
MMKFLGKWRKESPPGEETAFASRDPAPAPAGKPADSQSRTSIGKGKKILVVDDNLIVLKAFELKLKGCGFDVVTTTEGATAVSLARQQKPDLIVLDINFPPDVGSSGLAWDGFSIMQWMRRFQEASSIPVIVITSGEAAKYKDKALNAGASGFFQKPINFDDFLLAAHRAISQNAKAPATEAN